MIIAWEGGLCGAGGEKTISGTMSRGPFVKMSIPPNRRGKEGIGIDPVITSYCSI